jgi:hypothetical protein
LFLKLTHFDPLCKALIRRSKAYEQSGMLTECLEDVTAVCILEEFNKQESLETADRVLKALGKKEAGRCFQVGAMIRQTLSG